ncbi:nucleoside diphosphate kinase [Dunaliella salina]|uniref:nucleoside-diphosphate kinase n=1 Tax=Dunaliella salina TaxID=3046 RepID=A0ABQ7H135_DUNSA|nr:nucleoside diphosphate kinase [Dunaliella salina]|eukprot:KAF5840560.1 nucleoside diphosphate kinase [Dunaliella salina]
MWSALSIDGSPGEGMLGLLSSNHAFAAAPSTKERSFIAIKPDGVHRGMIANIISRFEQKGYKLVGIKVIVPGMDLAQAHYAEHEGKPFYPKLTSFLTSGPVVAMVWEGKEVIKYGRTMIGATNPLASAPGTIREKLLFGSNPQRLQSTMQQPRAGFMSEKLSAPATSFPHTVSCIKF